MMKSLDTATGLSPSTVSPTPDLIGIINQLGPMFAEHAAAHDRTGEFVAENYRLLKEHRVFAALVPAHLGGLGVEYSMLCDALRQLAHHDPATALAVSMHSHLVAAALWKHRHMNGPDGLLRKVAAEQCVLVSTGANDWLESSGSLERVDGGYLFTARKPFASGSPAGDLAITSAPYTDPADGSQVVLHFAAPLRNAAGVRLLDDWDTLGMRATGSGTMAFERCFIPETAIALRRPRGKFHPVFNVVCGNAMPLVMSVYLGVAERARNVAVAQLKSANKHDELALQLLGELENLLTTCQLAVADMVRLADDGRFAATNELSAAILSRKTIAAKSAIATVEKAMELSGGRAFYRTGEIERLLRDVHAAQFHPLPEKPQQRLTARVTLGLEPV